MTKRKKEKVYSDDINTKLNYKSVKKTKSLD